MLVSISIFGSSYGNLTEIDSTTALNVFPKETAILLDLHSDNVAFLFYKYAMLYTLLTLTYLWKINPFIPNVSIWSPLKTSERKRRTQLTFTCSKSTIKALEKGMKYVQN